MILTISSRLYNVRRTVENTFKFLKKFCLRFFDVFINSSFREQILSSESLKVIQPLWYSDTALILRPDN